MLDERAGWGYSDFEFGSEKYVVSAGRLFRYPPGAEAGRAEARVYGRSLGVPDSQLD